LILSVLEEHFNGQLVSFEVTESTTQIEVLIPVSSVR
jgi:hypothetical protein